MKCLFCCEEILDTAKKCSHCGEWQGSFSPALKSDKDKWDKWELVVRALSLFLIPIVVAVIGSLVNQSIKGKEVDLRMIELSVEILKAKPTTGNKELREWALNIIDKHADVKISEAARKELEKSPLPESGKTNTAKLGVKVIVKTVNNKGEEVSGYAIFYKLGIFANSHKTEAIHSFSELSSPSAEWLAPGKYLIWAGKPGQPEPSLDKQMYITVKPNPEVVEFVFTVSR